MADGQRETTPPRRPRPRRPAVGARLARRRMHGHYARAIRLLKLVLPTIAAILIGIVAVWPQIRPGQNKLPLAAAEVSAEEIENLAMINARFMGIDGRNQPFTVTAEMATEAAPNSKQVQLSAPKADITLQNGTWLALTADSGVFRQDEQTVELEGHVNMFHDAGYEFETTTAFVDLGQGAAFGFEPIDGQGPFGTIEAEGFQVFDEGERVIFTGNATLVLRPQAKRATE
ncbi:MAG: LPS export ABC transporter periplasmic protein LptC [Rhodospirillaceae bacterium]|nr:LPS export ABC transporter periplasmic protein LptC [Rhodospirillaceae bacterium]MBT6119129.1 LPS export ABC transporter periplasmic protein LptC [Rhodospirillaceae bacterium]